MKRDMELVREIVLKIEDLPINGDLRPENTFGDYTRDQIAYHIQILAQADLVVAEDGSSAGDVYWIADSLTWKGHEFLDAVKTESVWQQTKAIVKDKGGDIPFSILQSLAISVAAKYFGVG